jgi:hypothetical protein
MRPNVTQPRRLAVCTAIALALLAPLSASAQSQLDVSQAQAFMGNWVVAMDTDFGPFSFNVDIVDQGGKVAVNVGSPEMGGSQSVTNVTRNGEQLVMNWDLDAQGQVVDAMMTLEPNGANLDAEFDVAGGQFVAAGVGTRAN